jgi:hypothetical protein
MLGDESKRRAAREIARLRAEAERNVQWYLAPMGIPAPEHPVWSQLVTGERAVELDFLAAKMLIVRLRMKLREQPRAVGTLARELHSLYVQNAQLPSAQRDVAKLQGGDA